MTRHSVAALAGPILATGCFLICASPAFAQTSADLVIHGGTVYTGADQPPFVGDVVVTDDKIVAVGPEAGQHYQAKQLVEAHGKIVAPGFIDAHTHPDTYIRSSDPRQRLNAPWLFQGVTTVVIGVDGAGPPDIKAQQDWYRSHPVGTNLAPYVGFGAVREAVLKEDARAPGPAELEQMRHLVVQGMCEGAIGLSTGLFYAPQSYARTDEVIALAKEAALRGGIYDTHQRDESSYSIGLLASVREVLTIGREAGLPVHFAHIKALGVDVQGQAPAVIALIDAARAAGQEVTADQYPWAASSTGIDAALLPRWSTDGGRAALLKRLETPTELQKIRSEMRDNLRRRGGPDAMLFIAGHYPWTGKTLAQMAQSWKVEPVDAALRVIRSDENAVWIASFNMADSDIRLFMRQPWVVTSSDGNDGHPRQYATFPTKYAQYVRAAHVITVDEFIRGSTGRTADILRLDRRGYLKPGYFADVVVFDPDRYAPRADYVHPKVLSVGVDELFVNGRQVLRAGQLTGAAPGRMLLHVPTAGTCPR